MLAFATAWPSRYRNEEYQSKEANPRISRAKVLSQRIEQSRAEEKVLLQQLTVLHRRIGTASQLEGDLALAGRLTDKMTRVMNRTERYRSIPLGGYPKKNQRL